MTEKVDGAWVTTSELAEIKAALEKAIADNARLAAECGELREAVNGFLLKYDQIAPAIDGMFGLNFARTGIYYSGPTWETEIKALKACIVPRIQEAKGESGKSKELSND